MEHILDVKNLNVYYKSGSKSVFARPVKKQVLFNVSFEVYEGEIFGIVGESGCGKSTLSKTVLGMNPMYEGSIVHNSVKPQMIFQDPYSSLNPAWTIRRILSEPLLLSGIKNREDVDRHVIEMLGRVGLDESYAGRHPSQLSGGQRQRVSIAAALIARPKLVIADEPLSALDVTIQAQILELMQDLQKKLGMAIIMVTHDLGVIASMCDEIIVMYGGRVCERGTADAIFYHPAHEYTKGLLRSIPKADNMNEKLVPIGGTPINLLQMPAGCAFCPRCDAAMKICLSEKPEELRISDTHLASCWMNIKELYEAQEEAE